MCISVPIEYIIGNAFLVYNRLTEKRILNITTILEYKHQVELFWKSNSIEAEVVSDYKTVFKNYSKFFEFVKGDNAVILHNLVTAEMLEKEFKNLPKEIINSFEDSKVIAVLF